MRNILKIAMAFGFALALTLTGAVVFILGAALHPAVAFLALGGFAFGAGYLTKYAII